MGVGGRGRAKGPQQGGPGTPLRQGGAALGPHPCRGHSLQEEGPGHGLAPHVGPVEQRIQVWQQHVAQGEGLPHGSLRRLAEPVRLLRLQRGRESTWLWGREVPARPPPAAGDPALLALSVALRPQRDPRGQTPRSLARPRPYQAVEVVVVPHERVEGPQLGPAHTQLL